jgi:SnoaL-like domain
MDPELLDKLALRELIENWALWRDALMWEKFRTVWHDDGVMMATWTQGTADEFIAMSKSGFDKGVRILHFLGGSSIELGGTRAVAQTKMTISQRAEVEGVMCDVLCTGRFYDFLEKRGGKWGFVLRQPIYEKDRCDPLVPGMYPRLDPAKLATFPEGYKHLGYLQAGIGYPVKMDSPGLVGPEVERLYACGAAWLRGEALSWRT